MNKNLVGDLVFWQRIFSAFIGIPLLLAAVWYGGLPLLVLTAALMLIGLWEISRIFARIDLKVSLSLAVPNCLFLLVLAYYYNEGYPGAAVVLIIIAVLLAMVIQYPRLKPIDAAVTLLSIFYVGLIIFLFLISTYDNGFIWLIILLVCTWASDTSAYLIGRKLGKHPLAPALSPGKTLEGSVGGIIGGITAALAVTLFTKELPFFPVLSMGLIIGITAQAGDLVESAIKRQAGIKDSGRLIPGHGGILDRFDSMLFTAPFVFYYVGKVILS
ncbi:phosphatidate cytidylyltransferase [Desulfotruncus alcoholivorax]|uniref:phosphatidate cytidylyltransferase n=1 Tax=Desulfotruncus alcoholivorax TaxID=265477 RepID=UPI00041D1ECB|nr:phosphatidate cytidylyltransferase [Desulfotruncus alcoholivorax]